MGDLVKALVGTGLKIEMARLKVVNNRYAFRPEEMSVVNGIVWVSPNGLPWRLCLEVVYLSDGKIDYVPLEDVGENKSYVFHREEEPCGDGEAVR